MTDRDPYGDDPLDRIYFTIYEALRKGGMPSQYAYPQAEKYMMDITRWLNEDLAEYRKQEAS